ncbi:16S rRNA (cytosine(1402)-N(4))-methyltransferase RsmH [Candidatus Lucifugimonas marina]|uniref:Ribosomal RNA small subunit methyltransferase H n=1 Tax=Candidatus Lucifugimonas marina TaxID=3038979 RepID=A0AAJ5ZGT2_9CHLR|nr:16S rRNA (cytosine(1402)-N(4))-methyltransferase RsmH [SAR202 cluster bacterium JH702]MDG0869167.1 16S rRNA (cytosine(1402)-N(4))-methyltransferase RsmH [SAR202 cluster bacterium JH639]WFG35786.1 16S rRNA (cytosine(1402)-N(4))-methyltransferase RsmH [SAR202 cluster bacterium JH545]WFG39731.1 16S rRNA (cytosine(1402)-N(4))-methyltransferase RsmH [SAR202 cluster bacterium JH1073]
MGLELHHEPVMMPEIMQALNVQPGGRYIDGTLGEGGHSKEMLKFADPGGQVLGLDADAEAISVATDRLAEHGDAFLAINTNFRDIRATALKYEFVPVHGVLFDLGVSSLQLDRESRGFSFRRSDPLDMRFSFDQQITAADIVNGYAESELADIIFHLGEDRAARRIARAIVRSRPILTSLELADLIEKVNPRRGKRTHPATRTFQAIRIAVNDELSALETALEQAVSLLGQGGRLAVISYHSLEDRIVKNFIRKQASDCICPPGTPICRCDHLATLKMITRRPSIPTDSEIASNPRARSAKLRVAERI